MSFLLSIDTINFLSGICPLIIFWPQVTLSNVTQIRLRVFPALRGSSIKFLSRGRPNYELSVVAIPCNLGSQSFSLSVTHLFRISRYLYRIPHISQSCIFFFRQVQLSSSVSFCAKNYAHIIHISGSGDISH